MAFTLLKEKEEKDVEDVRKSVAVIRISTEPLDRIRQRFAPLSIHSIVYRTNTFYYKLIDSLTLGADLDEFYNMSHTYLDLNGGFILQRVSKSGLLLFNTAFDRWKRNNEFVDMLRNKSDRY